ncbi:MAG: hypothetical protein QXP58_07070 [Thermoprotei archaeon]
MPKPNRRDVRVNARDRFLYRMHYATGIHLYKSSEGHVVERYVENIPLYGVVRLQRILFLIGRRFNYKYDFKEDELRRYVYYDVLLARNYEVRDWRGIP